VSDSSRGSPLGGIWHPRGRPLAKREICRRPHPPRRAKFHARRSLLVWRVSTLVNLSDRGAAGQFPPVYFRLFPLPARKGLSFAAGRTAAMCHVWTAPSGKENLDVSSRPPRKPMDINKSSDNPCALQAPLDGRVGRRSHNVPWPSQSACGRFHVGCRAPCRLARFPVYLQSKGGPTSPVVVLDSFM
jgi:hypothetical protein